MRSRGFVDGFRVDEVLFYLQGFEPGVLWAA
jgi:hypothetical protein